MTTLNNDVFGPALISPRVFTPAESLTPPPSGDEVEPAVSVDIAEAEAGMRPPIVQVGSLAPRRDFSDVRDIVRGYALALERGEPGEVYNLGSECAWSIQEILDILLGMSRVPLAVEPDPARLRPLEVPVVVSDCRKFRAQTGWCTTYTLVQSLRDVLEYWRERVK